jgi:hypothetical protein
MLPNRKAWLAAMAGRTEAEEEAVVVVHRTVWLATETTVVLFPSARLARPLESMAELAEEEQASVPQMVLALGLEHDLRAIPTRRHAERDCAPRP